MNELVVGIGGIILFGIGFVIGQSNEKARFRNMMSRGEVKLVPFTKNNKERKHE